MLHSASLTEKKLDDPGNLFEGTGKDMRHTAADTIDKDLLKKWIIASAE
jgi:hypothetical protein